MALTYRLTGFRAAGEQVVFEDGVVVFVAYPTPTSWRADVVLEPGVTEYDYKVGSGVWQTATITIPYSTPFEKPAFNVLDRWGQYLDTPRLPSEDNIDYKARLMDVFKHRGGPTHSGLINAIGRDFSLVYSDTAMNVKAAVNQSTGARFGQIVFGIGTRWAYVLSPDFIVTEDLFVAPVTGKITTSKRVSSSLKIVGADGSDIDYDHDPVSGDVYVLDLHLAGTMVTASYVYEERVDRLSRTVQEVADALEAIQAPWGAQVLEVAVEAGYGALPASNLSRVTGTNLASIHQDVTGADVEGLPVRWTDMRIQSVWDPDMQDSMRNESGSLWGTKIDSAAHSLRSLSKMYWGSAVADESIWGTHEIPLHGGHHLDTIYDPPLDAIPDSLFCSGPADTDDLKVAVASDDAIFETGTEGRHIIGETDEPMTQPDGSNSSDLVEVP